MDKDQDKKLEALLRSYKAPMPRHDYVQVFWVNLVRREQPQTALSVWLKLGFGLSVAGMFLFGVMIFDQMRVEGQIAQLSPDQVQMLAYTEVVENLEVLQDFTAISSLDELQELDSDPGTV